MCGNRRVQRHKWSVFACFFCQYFFFSPDWIENTKKMLVFLGKRWQHNGFVAGGSINITPWISWIRHCCILCLFIIISCPSLLCMTVGRVSFWLLNSSSLLTCFPQNDFFEIGCCARGWVCLFLWTLRSVDTWRRDPGCERVASWRSLVGGLHISFVKAGFHVFLPTQKFNLLRHSADLG